MKRRESGLLPTTNSRSPHTRLESRHETSSTYSRFKGVFISIYTKKFVTLLKQSSQSLRFKSLREPQFSIIGDPSAEWDYYYYQNLLSTQPSFSQRSIFEIRNGASKLLNTRNSLCLSKILSILQRFNILILPNSHLKIIIDFSILTLLLMNLIYIPIELCFDQSLSFESDLILYIILKPLTVIAFILEIMSHSNTAIYVNGLVISNRREILREYLKLRVWWDLLIILPLTAGIYLNIWVLKLLIVVRFLDVLKILQELEDRFILKDRFRGQIQLLKLMFFILCLAHLIASTWFKLAAIQRTMGVPLTWVGNTLDQDPAADFEQLYVRSFYWTVVTMTTLGYGDITPKTEVEQIFAISVGLLSTVVFAFSVSSIGEILREISKKQSELRTKMSSIEHYMIKRNLNQQLRLKVRKYFTYLYQEEQENTNEGAEHLQKLAASLREEVFVDMYGRLLKSKKLFDLHFSTPFLNQLALRMKETTIAPETIIYDQGQPGNRLFFVISGEVEMISKIRSERDNSRKLCSIKEGNIFGECEFFSGGVRVNSARSVNVTNLVYIELNDFLETLKGFPSDYEHMMQTKDSINLYDKASGLDHKCFGCGNFDHRITGCPLVTYTVKKSKILKLYNTKLSCEYEDHDQSFEQSPSLIYKNNAHLSPESQQTHRRPTQADMIIDHQFLHQLQQQRRSVPPSRYFQLNKNFIAAETPKHPQQITRMKNKQQINLFSRKQNTNKSILVKQESDSLQFNHTQQQSQPQEFQLEAIIDWKSPSVSSMKKVQRPFSVCSESVISNLAKIKPNIITLNRIRIGSKINDSPILEEEETSNMNNSKFSPIKKQTIDMNMNDNFARNDSQNQPQNIKQEEESLDNIQSFSPPSKQQTTTNFPTPNSPPLSTRLSKLFQSAEDHPSEILHHNLKKVQINPDQLQNTHNKTPQKSSSDRTDSESSSSSNCNSSISNLSERKKYPRINILEEKADVTIAHERKENSENICFTKGQSLTYISSPTKIKTGGNIDDCQTFGRHSSFSSSQNCLLSLSNHTATHMNSKILVQPSPHLSTLSPTNAATLPEPQMLLQTIIQSTTEPDVPNPSSTQFSNLKNIDTNSKIHSALFPAYNSPMFSVAQNQHSEILPQNFIQPQFQITQPVITERTKMKKLKQIQHEVLSKKGSSSSSMFNQRVSGTASDNMSPSSCTPFESPSVLNAQTHPAATAAGSQWRFRETIEDFDQLKTFSRYFIKNNIDPVIQSFNKSRKNKAIVIQIHQSNMRRKKKNLLTKVNNFHKKRKTLDPKQLSEIVQEESSHKKSLFFARPSHPTLPEVSKDQIQNCSPIFP